MSEKLSINVKSIGLNVTHNFIVPDDMNTAKMVKLIAKTIQDEYPGVSFEKDSSHFLVQETSGRAVNNDCCLKQLGIVNGEKFILV